MKDLFMFKVTQVLENEDEKEITSLFGFKIRGAQMELFSHRGPLPTAHMIGHALRDSGIIDKYERKHPYIIEYNSGQSGHTYYDLYYFPIISGNYILDTGGPLVTIEGAAIKKKAASFEYNSTGKIAPEMIGKSFYINDFIDFILEGMEPFICTDFKIEEIELKKHKMNNSPRVDEIKCRFNKELDCIFDCRFFHCESERKAVEVIANIKKEWVKGFVSIGDVFRMNGVLHINKRYQPDYERFGWYQDDTVGIAMEIDTETGETIIDMPEPVQKEEK